MTWTLEQAYEYVAQAAEAEGEQRAEYGMGCVSLGYDPSEWGPAYEGYRCADDPDFQRASRMMDAAARVRVRIINPAPWAAGPEWLTSAPAEDEFPF